MKEFWIVESNRILQVYDTEDEAIRVAGRYAENDPAWIHHWREGVTLTREEYRGACERVLKRAPEGFANIWFRHQLSVEIFGEK